MEVKKKKVREGAEIFSSVLRGTLGKLLNSFICQTKVKSRKKAHFHSKLGID